MALEPLAWGSARAGSSLAMASTAWLVSGFTPSPLVNSLLPAIGTMGILLPLPRHRPLLGAGLQILATAMLLTVSIVARVRPSSPMPGSSSALLACLLAMFLLGLGLQMAALPLQRFLVQQRKVPMGRLQTGSDLGTLTGQLLTAVLFPLGQALLQYLHALLLLLPILPAARRAGRPAAPPQPESRSAPLNGRCVLHGLLFGGLFGLLPLWVRQESAGSCFDFGMLLTAYVLGRTLAVSCPPVAATVSGSPRRLTSAFRYLSLALLLLATQWLPGWGALTLFVPLGVVAGLSDAGLVATLDPRLDLPLRWQTLLRSSAFGALVGSLLMGVLAQSLGLPLAFPLQVAAFVVAAILLSPVPPVPVRA